MVGRMKTPGSPKRSHFTARCQNVPSAARVAAGAFGFLTLIQLFDARAVRCVQFEFNCGHVTNLA